MAGEQRKLAAIMVADVVGYSKLIGSDEAGTVARLKALLTDVIEPVLAKHSGRLFKAVGDGFLAEFASAVQAVTAAQSIQQANAGSALLLRIGIHVGDVIVQDGDLLGDGVNIAARIEDIAEAGGIAISRQVRDQVRDKLEVELIDKGEVELKNITRPVRIFTIGGTKAQPEILALPDKPSIAVLPFQNMSGDPDQEYFADGLAEDLITSLSRVSWLFVIARNSSFALRGEKLDVQSIGKRLGVRYLVEGSVRRAGQRLRLNVQLIEAATGNHLWADRYDGSMERVFDLQDRIVASLIGAIEPKLWAVEIARARRKRTDSLDAFDLFLQALPKAAAMSAQGLAEAIGLLDRAISLSPDYAQALAYGALCRSLRPILSCSPDEGRDFREASDYSRRALESDPTDPIALRLAGFTDVIQNRDYQTGRDLVDRSLAINPNDAVTWSTRAWIDVWSGETDAAMEHFEKAMRLSPLDPHWASPMRHGMTFALCYGGRAAEAVPWARTVLQERPDWGVAHRVLVAALWLSGRHAEARDAAARHNAMFPEFSVSHDRDISPVRGTPGHEGFFHALREAGLPA